jgi:hypothetical protein
VESRLLNEVDVDAHSLAAELASAVATESLPAMLCALLKRAQLELQAWHEGSSVRGLAIARLRFPNGTVGGRNPAAPNGRVSND